MEFDDEPGRPYRNFISKSGALPVRDIWIKLAEIQQAVKKYVTERKAMFGEGKTSPSQPHNRLLMLPAEIRNQIYSDIVAKGSVWVPNSGSTMSSKDPRANIMRLSKQITQEVSTLMEDQATAYVPIMGMMDFKLLIREGILKHGIRCLPPSQSTIMHALTTFRNVEIRLHTRFSPSQTPDDKEPTIDLQTHNLFSSLRQALRIFTTATPHITGPAQGEKTIKRRCTLHFDHAYSDWHHMICISDPFRFSHLCRMMSEDRDTEWEIRYFVYATGEKSDAYWNELDQVLVNEHDELQKECDKYPNVKLVAEVYGEREWSLEGKQDDATRDITLSSLVWPSWPEDAPSRKRKGLVDDECEDMPRVARSYEDKVLTEQ
ncbi:hypothetical protein NX059_009062 [Plenodomus lindquistii]|nr:hypothetical protein NX059_009062 [Plenodomus lindquistii]